MVIIIYYFNKMMSKSLIALKMDDYIVFKRWQPNIKFDKYIFHLTVVFLCL